MFLVSLMGARIARIFQTKKEIMSLRFNYNMNLLQLICFEEATLILDFIRAKFEDDMGSKRKLA